MEKTEDNNTIIQSFKKSTKYILFLAVLILLCSCEKAVENIENPETSAGNSHAGTARALSQQSGREAILIRGNYWMNGIPGFDDNSFPAFTGEYMLRAQGKEERFLIYLSPGTLHFAAEWQPRRETESIRVLQRQWEGGFLAATILSDGNGVFWTAVFYFPSGLEASSPINNAFNQMLRPWTYRFLYFLSLARNPGDISLPAVLEF